MADNLQSCGPQDGSRVNPGLRSVGLMPWGARIGPLPLARCRLLYVLPVLFRERLNQAFYAALADFAGSAARV